MKFSEIARISFTNLKSNRMRTLLTIVGISIGITSIVFLVSLGYGLQELSIKKIASIEAINTLDITTGKSSDQKVDDDLINQLKTIPEISKISPLLALGAKMDYEGRQTDSVGNFIDDDYATLEGINPVLGAFFSNSEKDIVVSTALLKAINLNINEAVNKQITAQIITVNSGTKERKSVIREYRIVGVVQDDSTSFSYIPIISIKGDIT